LIKIADVAWLSLNNTALELETSGNKPANLLKSTHVTSRNSKTGAPSLQFTFSFAAPKPLKRRIILKRDRLGRILDSKVARRT